MTITREFIEKVIRSTRVSASLNSKGITVKHRRNLDKMTNIQTCWGGHLKDATCHYTWRFEWSGNTYPIRHILKAAGFRWDAGQKAWWMSVNEWTEKGLDSTELSCEILRELDNIKGATRRIKAA